MADQLIPYSDSAPAGERLPAAVRTDLGLSFEPRRPLQGSPLVRSMVGATVMDTPPTITDSATATLAQLVQPVAPQFRYSGAPRMNNGGPDSIGFPRGPRRIDAGAPTAWQGNWVVEFDFDGAAFEMIAGAVADRFWRIWVDGRPHASTPQPFTVTGAKQFKKINFGSRAYRRIVIEFESGSSASGAQFFGIQKSATDTIYAPSIPTPRIAWIGDSYGYGIGPTWRADALPVQTSRLLGWMGVMNFVSVGSTGILEPGPNPQLGMYSSRFADLDVNYDVIVFQGSINDKTQLPAANATIGPKFLADLQAIRTAQPKAIIIATSPLTAATTDTAHLYLRDQEKAAAESLGIPYIDALSATLPVFTGTGRVGATTGDGNGDYYRHSDSTHLSDDGTRHLARYLASQIAPLVGQAVNGVGVQPLTSDSAVIKFATRSVSLQGSEKIKRMADAPSYAPTLMSAVPTVVQSATQNPANAKTVTYTDPAFQWPGFVDVAGGSATPRHYTKQDGSGVAAGVPVTQVAFDYDGQQFDAVFKAVAGMKYRIWVNERAATTGMQSITETGVVAYFNVDLGSAAVGVPRRIVIELESPATPINFYGIRTPGAATTIAPSIRSPRVMLIGDSYGGGAGGTLYVYGYGRTLARLMGWSDMWTSYTSISSTGLVRDASSSVGRYITRLVGDVIPHSPDLVIIQGSLNDNPHVGQNLIGPALATYVNTLKAAHPNCVVVATSPLYVGDPPASYTQIRDEMAPVAADLGIPFIDMLTPKIFGGSGKAGATTGNGNADVYRSNDGTHPTNEGHNVIASVMAGKLGRVLGLAT